MKIKRIAMLAAVFGAALTNAGCVTTLVGGLLPSNNKVVIDEATVSPELKASLVKAKKLAFLSADKSEHSWSALPRLCDNDRLQGKVRKFPFVVIVEK